MLLSEFAGREREVIETGMADAGRTNREGSETKRLQSSTINGAHTSVGGQVSFSGCRSRCELLLVAGWSGRNGICDDKNDDDDDERVK